MVTSRRFSIRPSLRFFLQQKVKEVGMLEAGPKTIRVRLVSPQAGCACF